MGIAALLLAATLGSGLVAGSRAEAEVAGDITAFGAAANLGAPRGASAGFTSAIESTPSGNGYWITSTEGGVFTYGDAEYFGAAAELKPADPILDIASTPTGKGYWQLASNGAVFTYGDAQYFGGANTMRHPGWVVAIVPTKTGQGYWLISSDGGVFTYGDAEFFGAVTQLAPNTTVVDATRTSTGKGYWVATTDGGVFTFGDAKFFGSAAGTAHESITGIASAGEDKGYWLVSLDGGVFSFGSEFLGSSHGKNQDTITVDIAARPQNDGYWAITGPYIPPAPAVPPPAGGVWEALRNCEAGGNYATNTGNGYYGAYQFSAPTWRSMGTGYAYAHEAPYWVQDDAAQRLQARGGWGQWPACTRKLGLR